MIATTRAAAAALCVAVLLAPVAAQDAAAQDTAAQRPSIADQMVRHVLERDAVRPPVVRGGEPIGIGDGPIALLLRRADGELELLPLERPTKAAPPPLPNRPDFEEVQEAAAEQPQPGQPPSVRLVRVAEELQFGPPGALAQVGGARVDPAAVAEALRKLRGASTPAPAAIVIAPGGDVPLGDCAAVFAAARAAGFTQVMLSGGLGGPLPEAESELIDDAVERLGWQPILPARHPRPAIHGGELLLLFDREQRWDQVLPVYVRCMHNGLWRLAFVAVDADGARVKIPMPIPVDG